VKHLLSLVLLSVPVLAMDGSLVIPQENLFVPCKLGALSVAKKKSGFSVLKDGNEYHVANYNTDPLLKKANSQQLTALLANNGAHINVIKLSDGEYKLSSQIHGKGGGPLFALIGGTLVRVVCYSAPPVIVLTTAPASATVLAASATGGGAAMAAGGAAAGTATVGTITTGLASYVGGVEGLAHTVSGALLLCPWLP
jgi:hypothetical protein